MNTESCKQCGVELTVERLRSFVSVAKHRLKTTGKVKSGPFCSRRCGAVWRSEQSLKEYQEMLEQHVGETDGLD